MIIGISGYAGSGKDEVANAILRCNPFWDIKRYSGKLKQVAEILTGETDWESQEFKQSYLKWEMTGRQFLQKLGTDAIRDHLHPDTWVNALMKDYKPNSNWIIPDVRFLNEAEAIKERGGIIIRVDRGSPANSHKSETILDNYRFDFIISNNGTIDELSDVVKSILTLWNK
jgi:hypothetical protein